MLWSPREWWYARITSSPAYSPCEPGVGLQRDRAKPVISRATFQRREELVYPLVWSAGAKGCIAPNSGHVTGIISLVALSFIVHEPSGIMLCASDRSRPCSLPDVAQHLVLAVVALKTGCVR
jgi:hypothetical protein